MLNETSFAPAAALVIVWDIWNFNRKNVGVIYLFWAAKSGPKDFERVLIDAAWPNGTKQTSTASSN
jgi:hypothetical protein